MPDLVPVKRALLSVSDKTGLADFAAALFNEFKVELVSTGGTAAFLRNLGLPVTDVSEVTGFPEMMDGRVKTLHPKIHGGLLALRDNPDHAAAMAAHDIKPIDLLCINLYPFAATIEKHNVTLEEAIENIDIGGPAMIRSAAKNHGYVLVVTSPNRYEKVLGDLRKHHGSSCAQHRLKQAQSAFAHTAEYDGLIAKYLAKEITPKVEKESEIVDLTSVARFESEAEQLQQPFLFLKYVHHVASAQAVVAAEVETAAYSIGTNGSLDLLAKIASKHLDSEQRNALASVFQKCVSQSVLDNKDEVYPVDLSAKAALQTFCIVTLLRYREKPEAATAIILNCQDKNEALRHLANMHRRTAPYSPWRARSFLVDGHPGDNQVELPTHIYRVLRKRQDLRYGENPHQKAALYVDRRPAEASVAYAMQLHGKELSYINLLDADSALSAVKEFTDPAACIVKHATPCGCAAAAADLPTAFRRAFDGDPLAAFGGIVALNRQIDLATAQAIISIDKLLEVIVAPGYAQDALALLRDRWKNVRLLEVGPVDRFDPSELHLHKIVGGYLVQQRDLTGLNEADWKIASKRPPTDKELADLKFAWLVCKHVKSNAIVVAKDRMLLGAGAGQMDRPSAARLAITKAGDRVKNAVAASDAFFPFPDGPKLLLDAGVTAIIHPGGSLKDQDTINLVNERGAAMVLTGQRHFKH